MLTWGILISSLASIFALIRISREFRSKDIKNAVLESWRDLKLDQEINEIKTKAEDIRKNYRDFEKMLLVPIERASFAELALETIISDQLPPDMYGIRKEILDGKRPDAYIRSTVGIICIDSKFSLDNYKKMLNTEDPKEKDKCKKQFIDDIKNRLNEVAEKYVCPGKGSAKFAFAYIPSESVYYFLVSEAFEMLRDSIKSGVQILSPLTLSHKIELIKAGVYAQKLSENTEKVKGDIDRLSNHFFEIDNEWRIFYDKHFKDLRNKADNLDKSYNQLKEEFNKIRELF